MKLQHNRGKTVATKKHQNSVIKNLKIRWLYFPLSLKSWRGASLPRSLSRSTIFLVEILFFSMLCSFCLPQNGNYTNFESLSVVHLIKFSFQPNFSQVSHKFLFFVVSFSLKTLPPHREATKETGRNRNFTDRKKNKKLLPGPLCPAKTKRIPAKLMRRRLKRLWADMRL